MRVEEHESLEQLQTLMKNRTRVRGHRRFRGRAARQGKTAPQIAEQLSCGHRPGQRRVERSNKGGAAGLWLRMLSRAKRSARESASPS